MKNNLFCLKQTPLSNNINIMIIAILIDALIGDPPWLYKKIAHPVIYIGKLIDILDTKLNRSHISAHQRKQNGFLAIILIAGIPTSIGLIFQKFIQRLFPRFFSNFLLGFLASTLIAQRSLYNHVSAVKKQINNNDLTASRHAVSLIVGRNTENLDYPAICRAAIESLAENFSDGIIAPILWGCFGGLPGIIFYKAINTADSMIGHLTEKHRHFGYAAAKTDDYVNYPAARFSALLILLAKGSSLFTNIKRIGKDAKTHNSPNAGWPEAAMAHSLSIQLAGPRHYKEKTVNTPWIGTGKNRLDSKDIQRALTLFIKACFLNLTVLILLSTLRKRK